MKANDTPLMQFLGRLKQYVFAIIFLVLVSLRSISPALSADFVAQPSCTSFQDRALGTSARSMCEGKLLEAFATLTNQTFRLAKPLAIVGTQCGQVNAFYDRSKNAIFVCYELWKNIVDRMAREKRTDRNDLGSIAAGALSFVFLHELGHTLIDHFSLPVLGREEDAADQIATFLLIRMAGNNVDIARYWTVGAHWFFNKRQLFFTRGHFSGEHSVDPQRQFNIACWIYGSDPNKYAGLAQYARLPTARAQRCQSEYQQMLNAARQMLEPHLVRSSMSSQPGMTPDPSASGGSDPSVRENPVQSRGASMAEKAMMCHNAAQAKNFVGYDRQNFIAECYRANGVIMRQ